MIYFLVFKKVFDVLHTNILKSYGRKAHWGKKMSNHPYIHTVLNSTQQKTTMCIAYVHVLAYVCERSAAGEFVAESNSRWKKKPSDLSLAQSCATLQLYVWLFC